MKVHKDKNKKKIIIAEGQFIRFVKRGHWEYFERNNCGGMVIILAMTKEKEVLFVEQYRPPVDNQVIEFPAGLIQDKEHKESFIQGARRELLEETGFYAKKIKKLFYGPASSGMTSDMLTVMMASDLEKVHEGGGDETESIKVHKIPFFKVEAWLDVMRKKGRLVSPRIYAGLYLLAKYNENKIKD